MKEHNLKGRLSRSEAFGDNLYFGRYWAVDLCDKWLLLGNILSQFQEIFKSKFWFKLSLRDNNVQTCWSIEALIADIELFFFFFWKV